MKERDGRSGGRVFFLSVFLGVFWYFGDRRGCFEFCFLKILEFWILFLEC